MSNDFTEIYKNIKGSVVAIASKISTNFEMPDIIGTGFVAREDGVIFTNDHVIKALKRLPRTQDMPEDEWSAFVLLFKFIPDKGMAIVPLEIAGVGIATRDTPFEGYNYGTDIPDIGFIRVKVKNLPALKIADTFDLGEGDTIMTAGFPMGTDALRAPGWLHQISPVLQEGIVSSILPFPCDDPHSVLLNIMVQGGASGSPVFNPKNGEVVGIINAGLIQPASISLGKIRLPYTRNTTLSYAVPAKIVKSIFDKINFAKNFDNNAASKFETLEELMGRLKAEILPPKTGKMGDIISPDKIIYPSGKK